MTYAAEIDEIYSLYLDYEGNDKLTFDKDIAPRLEALLANVRLAGYTAGRQDGYNDGHTEGYEAGRCDGNEAGFFNGCEAAKLGDL